MKIKGVKMKMSQIFDNDRVIPVTPIRLQGAEIEGLEKGTLLAVRGRTKGKGFQGVVKRHGFHGGPKSHGQKDRHRAPGSIGAGGVQRVIKGMKMAGQTGGVNVTVSNLKVVEISKESHTIFVKGAVPGNIGNTIEMTPVKSLAKKS
jgi:large subunit ribosomal protein L3